MSTDVIRVRLSKMPSARDLEYLALRYVQVGGVYELTLELANDLIELGYAVLSDPSVPPTILSGASPDDDGDFD